ncbi:MAG: M15 family metallopeptidase [Aureispira sp.]
MAISKAVKERLNTLKANIEAFLKLHKNPYDSSIHNELAAKLERIDSILHNVNHDGNQTTEDEETEKTIIGTTPYTLSKANKDEETEKTVIDTAPYAGTETWDHHTNRRIRTLDTRIQSSAFQFVNMVQTDLDITIRVSDAFRTLADQDALYNSGRGVTRVRGGQSYHNYGLAIDVVEIRDGRPIYERDWTGIANIGKGLGFEWGGDWTGFVDKPHFQMTFGQSVRELCLQRYPDRAKELGYS